jgi:hypothetical protein
LGLAIQYVGQDKAFRVVDEYDRQILFLLLVCAYKFLNPTKISEKLLALHPKLLNPQVCYDLMEINEDVALPIVKEQLTHFKIQKVIQKECQDPLAWWKAHEQKNSYVGFVI